MVERSLGGQRVGCFAQRCSKNQRLSSTDTLHGPSSSERFAEHLHLRPFPPVPLSLSLSLLAARHKRHPGTKALAITLRVILYSCYSPAFRKHLGRFEGEPVLTSERSLWGGVIATPGAVYALTGVLTLGKAASTGKKKASEETLVFPTLWERASIMEEESTVEEKKRGRERGDWAAQKVGTWRPGASVLWAPW